MIIIISHYVAVMTQIGSGQVACFIEFFNCYNTNKV